MIHQFYTRTLTIKIFYSSRYILFFLVYPVSRKRKMLAFPLVSTNIRTLRLALPLTSSSIVMVTFENMSWRFVPYQRHVCIISASLQALLASCCLSYRGKHVRKRLSCSNGSNQKHTVRSESIISKGRENVVGFGLCGPLWFDPHKASNDANWPTWTKYFKWRTSINRKYIYRTVRLAILTLSSSEKYITNLRIFDLLCYCFYSKWWPHI